MLLLIFKPYKVVKGDTSDDYRWTEETEDSFARNVNAHVIQKIYL